MKKFYSIVLGVLSVFGLEAGAQTYTDITPAKFDFSNYPVGPLTDFWNANKQVNHGVAGSPTDENGFIKVSQAANFGDAGFAYFYHNQPTDPNNYTSIVDVDGIRCLQIGDSGVGVGFGGFAFIPTCAQTSGLMRTTMIFRVVHGTHNSHSAPNINITIKDEDAAGPAGSGSISLADLLESSAANKWYKFVLEYTPTYALYINSSQLIWGDNIQIAEVKFETVTDVPTGYENINSTTQATAEALALPVPVDFADSDLYSFCPNYNVTVPANVELYALTNGNAVDNKVVLESVSASELKAGEGVFIRRTPGSDITKANFTTTESPAAPIDGNLIVGATAPVELAAKEAYILAPGNQLRPCDNGTLAQGKAYIPASKITTSSSAPLRIVLGTTAITDIDVDAADNQEYYNVFGQKVNANYRGIVISKGHKIYNR